MMQIFDFPVLNSINFISIPVSAAKFELFLQNKVIDLFLPKRLVSVSLSYVLLYNDTVGLANVQHPIVVCELMQLHTSNRAIKKSNRLIFRLIPVFMTTALLFNFRFGDIINDIDVVEHLESSFESLEM